MLYDYKLRPLNPDPYLPMSEGVAILSDLPTMGNFFNFMSLIYGKGHT